MRTILCDIKFAGIFPSLRTSLAAFCNPSKMAICSADWTYCTLNILALLDTLISALDEASWSLKTYASEYWLPMCRLQGCITGYGARWILSEYQRSQTHRHDMSPRHESRSTSQATECIGLCCSMPQVSRLVPATWSAFRVRGSHYIRYGGIEVKPFMQTRPSRDFLQDHASFWSSTSRSEEDHGKPNPASHDAYGRIRADEHQRQKLVLGAEYELMHQ